MKHSNKLSCFFLMAGALPLLARADVPCGKGLRSMVALRCGDDPYVSFFDAPPIEDTDTCSLVDSVWAQNFCYYKVADPVLEPALTGCFSEADGPWDLLGVTIDDPGKFCRSFSLLQFRAVTVSDEILASFITSESFEGPDALAAWDLDISVADDENTVRIVCSDDWTTTENEFTEDLLVPFPPDGDCAAEVQGGCDDSGNGGTNTLTRTFAVLNTGCTSGMGSYKLQFAVAWENVEFCYDDGYEYPYNDRATVRATVSGGPEEVVATFTACADITSGEWETLEVDIGEVPLGTALTVSLAVSATNVADCSFDSSILIDDIRIVEA